MSATRALLIVAFLGLAALGLPRHAAAQDEGRDQAITRSAAEAAELEGAGAKPAPKAPPARAEEDVPLRKAPPPGQTSLATSGVPGKDKAAQSGKSGKAIYGEIVVHK